MNNLVQIVQEIFNNTELDIVIGYEISSKGTRPLFCRSKEDVLRLVLNEKCINNIAVYLTRKDIIGKGKILITATIPVLRSIIQLHLENQIDAKQLIVVTKNKNDEVIIFSNIEEIIEWLEDYPLNVSEENSKLVENLRNMPREERWEFWKHEMSRCIKCYACRAACPLCYCSKCIVDTNCPQWIQPWSTTLSNIEWQINRVMHLTGRCTNCGACAEACPERIPIHLITISMMENIKENFGDDMKVVNNCNNLLANFNVSDKENFIL